MYIIKFVKLIFVINLFLLCNAYTEMYTNKTLIVYISIFEFIYASEKINKSYNNIITHLDLQLFIISFKPNSDVLILILCFIARNYIPRRVNINF